MALNTCRICKEMARNGKKLFEVQQTELLKQIELLTGEWLNYDPNWPSYICVCCEDDLEMAIAFRERCIQTQAELIGEQINTAMTELEHLDPLTIMQKSEVQTGCGDTAAPVPNEQQVENEPCVLLSVQADANGKQNEMQLLQVVGVLNVQLQPSADKSVALVEDSQAAAKVPETPIVSTENQESRILWSVLTREQEREILRTRSANEDYICDICGKHFTRIPLLKAHLRRHKALKKFKCTTCHKCFKTQSDLNYHDVMHTGIQRYPCRYCKMGFLRCRNRIEHERRVHTHERPFKCRFCQKGFVNSTYCKRHEFVHSTERNFHCTVCDERFNQQAGLRHHEQSKKHKNMELFKSSLQELAAINGAICA